MSKAVVVCTSTGVYLRTVGTRQLHILYHPINHGRIRVINRAVLSFLRPNWKWRLVEFMYDF